MKRTIVTLGLMFGAAASAANANGQEVNETLPVRLQEAITLLFKRDLPNGPGKAFLAMEVAFPPGAASPPHKLPAPAFIYAYVLSGEIISAVGDAAPRLYRAGEGWHEDAGVHHMITRNASQEKPAKLLVIFVAEPGERQLVVPGHP